MATAVVMPQMGESIAEGTIVRWIKKVGDAVDRDEPLFEISTDKVDAEIPSPAAGVLTEIKVQEGETVPVDAVVATIGQAGERPAVAAGERPAAPSAAAEPVKGKAKAAASTQPQPDGTPQTTDSADGDVSESIPLAERQASRAAGSSKPGGNGAGAVAAAPLSREELRKQKSSPVVRRIARDNHVDIGQISGSGIGGRVTKHDILEFMEHQPEAGEPSRPKAAKSDERVDIQPLSIIRRKIAEHMVMSRRTSAHVHSVFHVNFSTVERIRQQRKADYERLGARLTYTTFIAKSIIDALHRYPILNASLDGTNVIYRKDIHLGIAVALETGLIVPVIKNADEKNLLGLSRAIADVAERARTKQLKPEEVHGGTFTITNPGQFGAQFGMPIINQPQVAILGIGTIEKRPIVVDDAIAIRTMGYLTLGFDHRLVDGAVADQFMAAVKQHLEQFDPKQV